jgi:hypothetical protein
MSALSLGVPANVSSLAAFGCIFLQGTAGSYDFNIATTNFAVNAANFFVFAFGTLPCNRAGRRVNIDVKYAIRF